MVEKIQNFNVRFLTIDILVWGILILLLIPICLAPSKYQGWGGDYAGYLLEAKNIANGISLMSSNYLYNPTYSELAPPAYPIGFPLLLAPVYKIFGLDILVFARLICVLWWLIGVIMFIMLKRYFSKWASLIAVIFFVYHPLFYFARNAILSDFPFTICVLAASFFYTKPNNNYSIQNATIVGLFAGYGWLVRSIGFTLPLLISFHYVFENILLKKEKLTIKLWIYPLMIMGMCLIMQLVFHGYLFRLPESGSYFDQITHSNPKEYFSYNLNSYARTILNYFQLNEDLWYIYRYKNSDIAVLLGGAIAFGCTVIGLFNVNTRDERFFIFFILAYLMVILFWPSFQGLRFLLPIIPFFVYFLLKALKHQFFGSKSGNYLTWIIIPVLLCGEYYRIDKHIFEYSQVDEIGAPEWKDNQDAFQYIKDSIPAGATFAYHHPLIFALYAEKPAMRWAKNASPQSVQSEFRAFNVDYLLLNDWLVASDETMKAYLKENLTQMDTVWHNERNVLYRFK